MALTATQQSAYNDISDKLKSEFLNPVTHGDVNDVASRLKGLSAADADAVIDEMKRTGELDRFASEAVDGSWVGLGGYSDSERRDLFNDLAGKLDGASLASVSDAFAKASGGEDKFTRVGELGDAIASHASAATKVDYVKAMAAKTADEKPIEGGPYFGGGSFSRDVDPEAGAVGKVIGSLRGAQAEAAFNSLSDAQLRSVLKTGIDKSDQRSGGNTATGFDTKTYQGVMDAAASTSDADLKARIFDAGADQLRTIRDTQGIGIGQTSTQRGEALTAVSNSMTKLLDSDVTGITRELTYNTKTQDGSDLAAYAQVMIADGKEAKLGEQMAKLQFGNDMQGDPIQRLDQTTNVNGQERRENAGALGYFTGAVYAGAAEHSKDVKAQQETVTAVLKSVLTVVDKAGVGGKLAGTAASVGKEWVQFAVRGAIEDPGASPAQKLERAALPQDPSTNELGVGDPVANAFNTTLSRVQRTAQP
jgi:hypothetical protein